jgi:hypothetical protein
MEPDFSGYATKAGLKCSDGRTIMPDAFKHQDTSKVPLVWQHGHGTPENVLGHAILENRGDGVYAHGFFNKTDAGQSAKALVEHGDITALSIYANGLVEKNKAVMHGNIRELSLVLSGANPGAVIDFVSVQHSDGGIEVMDDEAVIFTGLELDLAHAETEEAPAEDKPEEKLEEKPEDKPEDAPVVEDAPEEKETEVTDIQHSADDPTIQDVFDTFSEEQKNVVYYMLSVASDPSSDTLAQSGITPEELTEMIHNVFESNSGGASAERPTLSHSQIEGPSTRSSRWIGTM